jgi:hypothetical protein
MSLFGAVSSEPEFAAGATIEVNLRARRRGIGHVGIRIGQNLLYVVAASAAEGFDDAALS